MTVRRLRLFDDKRTRKALAALLAVGVGGLLPGTAKATIDGPASPTTPGLPVAGDQVIKENAFGTPAPASGCTTPANNGAPGRTNFTLYKGTGTSTADAINRFQFQTQNVAAPSLWNWGNFRWSSGTYHYRTTTQNRAQTGSCALSTTANVQSDPYYVNLENAGKIVEISGAGNAGTTATISATLVDGSHGDKVLTATGQPTSLMPNRGYTVAGFPFTVGNVGGNTSALTPQGSTGTNNFLYTNSVDGFTPADMADGTSAEFFNRLNVTTDGGTKTVMVECRGVTKRAPILAALGITDTFTGFYGCAGYGVAGLMDAQTTITEARTPPSLTFTVAGHSETAQIDPLTGVAEVTIATPDVDAASGVPVTVTSSTDPFLGVATGLGAIDFKGGTVVTYDGDHEAFWNDSYDVSAKVVTELGGTDVSSGTVTFTRGTQVLADVPVDANGVASGTLTALDDPSTGQHVTATYNGTDVYSASEDTDDFTTKRRLTTLDYTGPISADFDEDIVLSAQLLDDALDAPLAGYTITFTPGSGDPVTAVTDANGIASKTVRTGSRVGASTFTATFGGVVRYAGSSDSSPFSTGFHYTFTDTLLNPGYKVRLNPETQQLGLVSANGVAGKIVNNAFQLSIFLPTDAAWPAAPGVPLPEIPEEWNILNLPRLGDIIAIVGAALGYTPPAVEAPSELPAIPLPFPTTSSASTQRAASGNIGGVVPTGGSPTLPDPINGSMTIGELIESLANANAPTSLSACMILSGSTCERRFIISATVNQAGVTVVGVFDVKTGLFAALVNSASGAKVVGSLGSCVSDPSPACPGLPTLPSGPPAPPSLPDLSGDGLLAALESLAAQLQALPDLLEAAPAPPADPLSMSSASAASPGVELIPGLGALNPTKGFVPWLP